MIELDTRQWQVCGAGGGVSRSSAPPERSHQTIKHIYIYKGEPSN